MAQAMPPSLHGQQPLRTPNSTATSLRSHAADPGPPRALATVAAAALASPPDLAKALSTLRWLTGVLQSYNLGADS